jgi:N,N'-diacetyllegionaminate synthase
MYSSTSGLFIKPKLIAEVGLAHDGSLGNALGLAKAAIKAGADIVKFQVHFPNEESSHLEKFRTNFSLQDKTRWAYWERTGFSFDQWRILKKEIEDLGSVFSASVFSSYALKMMRDLDVKVLKLGSGDLNNEELLEQLHDYYGTLILSSGMATLHEISLAADWLISSNCDENSALLQCTSKYPTDLADVGLNVMSRIIEKFGVKSGLSDHSEGISASIAALTLGASYVEKHVVYSHDMFGPDVSSSITFKDLGFLRKYTNDLEKIMKEVDKDDLSSGLQDLKGNFGRSLSLKFSHKKGYRPNNEDFCLRKPAGGLPWIKRNEFVGVPLKKDYALGEMLNLEHFFDRE